MERFATFLVLPRVPRVSRGRNLLPRHNDIFYIVIRVPEQGERVCLRHHLERSAIDDDVLRVIRLRHARKTLRDHSLHDLRA